MNKVHRPGLFQLSLSGHHAWAIPLYLVDVDTVLPGINTFTVIKLENEAMELAAEHFPVTNDHTLTEEIAILVWTQALDTTIGIAILKDHEVFTVDRSCHRKIRLFCIDLRQIVPATFTHTVSFG